MDARAAGRSPGEPVTLEIAVNGVNSAPRANVALVSGRSGSIVADRQRAPRASVGQRMAS